MVGISQAVGVATHPSEHSTVCIVLLEEFFCVTHIARGHHDCEFLSQIQAVYRCKMHCTYKMNSVMKVAVVAAIQRV